LRRLFDAALAAVEQRTLPGFAGTPDELDALVAEGLASKELTETDFWDSVSQRTDILLAERKTGLHPRRFVIGKPPPTLHNLRSWPVAGFEAIRIYYLLDSEAIHVIRVLHGKRGLKRILERERTV
jgi:plasmid stabilization system protein ParE